jgi:hypothetical protein
MHETISADPDVEQAVEDLRPIVERMRGHSAAAMRLPANSTAQAAEQREVNHLFEFIQVRADRIGNITADGLLQLINVDIDSRSRRGRAAPAQPTKRTLMTAVSDAVGEEAVAKRNLTAAQVAYDAAQRKRRGAEDAYRAYGEGRSI